MKNLPLLVLLLILAATQPGRLLAQRPKLDPTTFIVVGGGLAAGMSDLTLSETSQSASFPALVARQIGTILPMPLFRDGGSVPVISFDPGSPLLPVQGQSTLRVLPFSLFTFNLSVPFLKISESLNGRPGLPLVDEGNPRQSALNLTLGYPAMIFENAPLWSQIEYAESMAPTLVVVEMGSGDILPAALQADPAQMTPVAAFSRDYTALVMRLKQTFATVIVMNVPDPTDTAYFSTVAETAQKYRLDPPGLAARFGLQAGDLITLAGLVEIGDTLSGRRSGPLSPRSVLPAAVAAAVRGGVREYNAAIAALASANGIPVYDLEQFFKEVRASGVQAGTARLGGGYLEGFYSSDGLFPTPAGQAALANRLLQLINTTFQTQYPLVNLETIANPRPFLLMDSTAGPRSWRGAP